jgi:hypothetical protein
MYVRWQLYRSQARNPSHRERNDKRARLKAVLVENVRINGKPVQKHIAFLGSTTIDRSGRMHFWYDVMATLDRLSNRISRQKRKQITQTIVEKIGGQVPTKAKLRAFERNRQELLEAVRSSCTLLSP